MSDSDAAKMPELPDKVETMTNYDRILKHLDDGSLARQLVQAHRDRESAKPMESIKAVILKQLEQVRKSIDDNKA